MPISMKLDEMTNGVIRDFNRFMQILVEVLVTMATSGIEIGINEIPTTTGERMTLTNLEIVTPLEEEAVVVVYPAEAHRTLGGVIMIGEIIEDMMVHMDMVTIPEDLKDRRFISLTIEASGS